MDVSAPLVGREAEVEVMERALGGANRGRSRAVGVLGEPGIGKSRLLGELGRRAAGRGHLVLSGRAAELERDAPFALLIEAMDGQVAQVGAEPLSELGDERLADLAVALPAVSRVAGVAPAATIERHRVARAVRGLLGSVAGAQQVTVLLDDVHWADPASVDVIALLLHRLPPGGLLLGLAARAGRAPELEAALAAAEQDGIGEVVAVGPLPAEVVAEFLPGVGRAARERLYRDSGGNPFYLQELARAADSEVAGTRGTGRSGVPRAVQAALARELSALPGRARRVLEGAAVAGDPFEVGLAAVAADVAEAPTLTSLDELLAADLVRATGQPRRFRFRHPLVRRAVYDGSGGGWRLAAHARAAAALASRGATPAQRAHHVERAARPGDLAAVEVLAAAAEEAASAAPATAAGWYQAALRLLPEAPANEERRLALLRAEAPVLVSAGRVVEARDVLRQVLAMLPSGATAERVDVTVRLAGLEAIWTQRPEEARRLLEAERSTLAGLEPGPAAALTMALADERSEYGDHVATEALADRARREARAAGDPVLEAVAAVKGADAANCRLRGEDPGALAAVEAKIAEAGQLVDGLADDRVAERLYVLLSLTIARLFSGRLDSSLAAVERGLRLARATGQGLLAPALVCARGFVEQELGRLDAAEADEQEALESALISGNVQVEYWASVEFSWIALARGNTEGALAHGQRAWELLGTRSYSQAGFSVADARLAAGDPQGALAALEAFDWVRPQLWTLDRLKAADVAVRVLLALRRLEEAEAWANRVPAEGGGRRTGVFGAIIARARAAVLLAQGATPEAARVALAGAAAAGQGLAPLWAGRCRTLGGEALAACGRVEEARAELRRAAAELEARGAWGYRDAALRVLRRLGERPRPAARAVAGRARADGLTALTAREREVALFVGEGQTNAQIAARLQLSESTVEKHVSRVLGKLGLSSRAGVVRLLARERLGGG